MKFVLVNLFLCKEFKAFSLGQESVHALVAELQELGRLVCELCVPLPANSWSLLLSHMMDIQDLSMTMALVQMQVT